MFIGFFYTKYIKQAQSSSPPSTVENVRQSGKEAAKDLRQELRDAMASEQDGLETDKSDIPSQVADRSEKVNQTAEDFGKKARSAASNATNRVMDGAHQANDIFQEKGQQAADAISDKVNELNKKAKGPKETTDPKDGNGTGATDGTNDTKFSNNVSEDTSKASIDDASKQDMDKAPKLEPTSSSTDNAQKPKSRSVSPQKRTQLPRPQSKNRQQSPEKSDPGPKDEDKASKEESKSQVNGANPSKEEPKDESKDESKDEEGGDEEKPSSLDESAYEVNPDELENEEEKKAEAKMQPKSN